MILTLCVSYPWQSCCHQTGSVKQSMWNWASLLFMATCPHISVTQGQSVDPCSIKVTSGEHQGISNHQQFDWLLNSLLRLASNHQGFHITHTKPLSGTKPLSEPMLELTRTLGTNFSEIFSKIHTFSFKKMHLSSEKCHPFCLSLSVLKLVYFTPS